MTPEVVYVVRRQRPVDVEAPQPVEVEQTDADRRRLWATRGEIVAMFVAARRGET